MVTEWVRKFEKTLEEFHRLLLESIPEEPETMAPSAEHGQMITGVAVDVSPFDNDAQHLSEHHEVLVKMVSRKGGQVRNFECESLLALHILGHKKQVGQKALLRRIADESKAVK